MSPPQHEAPPTRRGRHGLCHSRTRVHPCQTQSDGGWKPGMSLDPIASRLAAEGVAFAPEIAGAARRYSLDPDLLAAAAAQETGGPDSNAGHNEGGNGREALSAYNAGSPTAAGTKTRWSDGADLPYAESVLRHYQRLTGESPRSSAIAESHAEIASTGALRAQAQRLPLPATPFAGRAVSPHTYQRQATDYLSLLNDDTDENNS